MKIDGFISKTSSFLSFYASPHGPVSPPACAKNTVFLRLPIHRPIRIFIPKIHLYLPFLRGPHFSIINFFLCQRQKKAGKPVCPIIMSPSPTVDIFFLKDTSNVKRLPRVNKLPQP